MGKVERKELGSYSEYTIDDMIATLALYKREMGGHTKVYMSDFEFNNKHKQMEFTRVEDEKELYIFFERHEGEWE